MKLPNSEHTLSLRATFNPEISNNTGVNPATITSHGFAIQNNEKTLQ
jgi:hypothetical protein